MATFSLYVGEVETRVEAKADQYIQYFWKKKKNITQYVMTQEKESNKLYSHDQQNLEFEHWKELL